MPGLRVRRARRAADRTGPTGSWRTSSATSADGTVSSSRRAATAAGRPSGLQPPSASSRSRAARAPAADDRRASRSRACDRRRRRRRARSPARCAAPSTHASTSSRVFGDRVAVRRGEDDVQLIEAAEAREERAERLDDAAVARQQRQHVGVEREPARRLRARRPATASTAATTMPRWRCDQLTMAATRGPTNVDCYVTFYAAHR